MALFSTLQACGQVFGAYGGWVCLISLTPVNAIALEAIGWKYYILYIISDVAVLVIAWFIMVETKGLTLEEIAVQFDGDTTMMASAQDVKVVATELEDMGKMDEAEEVAGAPSLV